MRKTMRVPLVELAEPGQGGFLEFWVEPAPPGSDPFQGLAAAPLQTALRAAREALAGLPPPQFPCQVFLANSELAVSASAGAALALALCPFLLRPDWPYPHYAVTGTLLPPGRAGEPLRIGDSGHLPAKLEALCRLGYQVEPLLLILPRVGQDAGLGEIGGRLVAQNIAVRRVADLDEAFAACSGKAAPAGEATHGPA